MLQLTFLFATLARAIGRGAYVSVDAKSRARGNSIDLRKRDIAVNFDVLGHLADDRDLLEHIGLIIILMLVYLSDIFEVFLRVTIAVKSENVYILVLLVVVVHVRLVELLVGVALR